VLWLLLVLLRLRGHGGRQLLLLLLHWLHKLLHLLLLPLWGRTRLLLLWR
jgi:hypothetical protein